MLAIVGMFALALAGVGLLALAVFSLLNEPPQTVAPTVTAAATAGEQVVFVPTTTPAPPTATPEPTAEPTEPPAATEPPSATPEPQFVSVILPANVRSGPGTTYPTLGGLNTGDTAAVVGRDSSGAWYAIEYEAAVGGVAWLSNLVSTFDGDVNSLPVIEASAAPPAGPAGPTSTTAPAGPANTSPPPAGPSATPPPAPPVVARGLEAKFFTVKNPTVAAGELIWFQFQVVNNSADTVSFGMLGAHTDVGFTSKSWNEALTAGRSLTHEDHIKITTPGTYQLYLGVCFNDSNSCVTGAQAWERLSHYVTVTVQ